MCISMKLFSGVWNNSIFSIKIERLLLHIFSICTFIDDVLLVWFLAFYLIVLICLPNFKHSTTLKMKKYLRQSPTNRISGHCWVCSTWGSPSVYSISRLQVQDKHTYMPPAKSAMPSSNTKRSPTKRLTGLSSSITCTGILSRESTTESWKTTSEICPKLYPYLAWCC